MSAPDSPPLLDGAHDPTVTRLIPVRVPRPSGDQLPAPVGGRGSAERRAEAAVTTSVSVVIVDHRGGADRSGADRSGADRSGADRSGADRDRDGAGLAVELAALSSWAHPRLRLELLVIGRPDDPDRQNVREMLSSCGCSWRLLDAPRGGRAAMLGLAAEQAEHEFVVVAVPGGPPPFEQIRAALALMWSEGGDAALVERRETEQSEASTADASAALVAWLGLDAASRPGRVVILRRWVARWLFNEVTRAISPAEEVADRARLLGIGIVHLVGDAAAPGSTD